MPSLCSPDNRLLLGRIRKFYSEFEKIVPGFLPDGLILQLITQQFNNPFDSRCNN